MDPRGVHDRSPRGGAGPRGFTDPSQHVPLLNCVANQVLGYYGNSMIVPFSIPAAVAARLSGNPDEGEERPLPTGRVQEALTQFHREAFSPPVSRIALPTRGVLGEAVLGHCSSAERINLTRFWNWQDSPIEKATDITSVALTPSSADNLTAPAGLSSVQPIINNVGTGDTTGLGALSQALVGEGPAATDFERALTGLDQLETRALDPQHRRSRSEGHVGPGHLPGEQDHGQGARAGQGGQGGRSSQRGEGGEGQDRQGEGPPRADRRHRQDPREQRRRLPRVRLLQAHRRGGIEFARANQELAGETLPLAEAATLFDEYDKSEGGSRTRGSKAFLTALGLRQEMDRWPKKPPPPPTLTSLHSSPPSSSAQDWNPPRRSRSTAGAAAADGVPGRPLPLQGAPSPQHHRGRRLPEPARTARQTEVRTQALAAALGIAAPPPGVLQPGPAIGFVNLVNDRPAGPAQPSIPATVPIRADFFTPLLTALAQSTPPAAPCRYGPRPELFPPHYRRTARSP